MRVRRVAAAVAASMVLIAGAAVPGAAVAQDFSGAGPLWYLDAMRITAIHDAGITGEGVTVAVFDGGLNPEVAALQGANIEVQQLPVCPDPVAPPPTDFEALQHGTSVTALLIGNGTSDTGTGPVGIAPGVRILYYGAIQEACEGGENFPIALADAVAQGADIVTMSGGKARTVDELAEPAADAVADALRAGVLITTSLPNRGSAWENELGKINGVVNVASVDATAQPAKERDGSDMQNPDVDVVAPGINVAGVGFNNTWGMSEWSGNSAATPLVAGVLALAKQKWPNATSAQLLQSLIRNTGSKPHELDWSATIGHGVVNATRIIEEDPSQYPDQNPLFTDGQSPTFDEVYAATETPPTQTPDPRNDATTSPLPWVVAGTAVGVVGVAAVIIVIMVRRKKPGGHPNV